LLFLTQQMADNSVYTVYRNNKYCIHSICYFLLSRWQTIHGTHYLLFLTQQIAGHTMRGTHYLLFLTQQMAGHKLCGTHYLLFFTRQMADNSQNLQHTVFLWLVEVLFEWKVMT